MSRVRAAALRDSPDVDSLDGVHSAIGTQLGGGIALLFAIGLLASRLASTAVGCYSGAVVMDGLLRVRVPLLTRRVITLVPALVVLGIGVDPTLALVLSQVVLSFGIPFALVPLVWLTARRDVMGGYANRLGTTIAAAAVAAAVIALNCVLIYLTV